MWKIIKRQTKSAFLIFSKITTHTTIMSALSIIFLVILMLVTLIVLILIKTINVYVTLGNNTLTVTLFKIKVFQIDYAKLISTIITQEKPKIKIKILPLINSISYVGIEIRHQRENIDYLDAYVYGLLNMLSIINIKRINNFKYQRIVGENEIAVKATLKFRLLNLLLSQFGSIRRKQYGEIN